MGHTVIAKCRECGNDFMIDHGGGFHFHLLRCEDCGQTKSIAFDELGDLHVRYVKGLPGPYAIVSAEHDKFIQTQADIDPISEDAYHAGIEAFAGTCICGGQYRLDAPPRCPVCRSTHCDEGEIFMMYD